MRKAWRKKPTIVQTLSFSGGKQEESDSDSDSDSDSGGDSSTGGQRTRRKKRKTNKRKRNKGMRNKGTRNKGKRNKGYPNKGKDDVVAIVNAALAKLMPALITQMGGGSVGDGDLPADDFLFTACFCNPRCPGQGSDTAHGSHGYSCKVVYERCRASASNQEVHRVRAELLRRHRDE